jgi:hypothetical protein
MSLEKGKTTLVYMFLHVSYINSTDSEVLLAIDMTQYNV